MSWFCQMFFFRLNVFFVALVLLKNSYQRLQKISCWYTGSVSLFHHFWSQKFSDEEFYARVQILGTQTTAVDLLSLNGNMFTAF